VTESLTKADIVSSELERLILVDENDQEVGQLDKSACHDGNGVRHRAFSLFVFNPAGELLIQQRAPGKRLWPDFWSNSCCSHPRSGETMAEAVMRRLAQELGLVTEPEFVYKFEYVARFGNLGTEHELCSVLLGRAQTQPVINTTEIRAWRWITADVLDRELELNGGQYTPWFQLEWSRLRAEHSDRLMRFGVSPAPQETAR